MGPALPSRLYGKGLAFDRGQARSYKGAQNQLVSCLGNKLFTFGGALGARPALPLLAIALL